MIDKRKLKTTGQTLAALDSDEVASANGSGDEVTLDSPLQIRLAELERRISAALTGKMTAHDLANLLMQCDLAVPQAEEFGKAELERALDPLQSPDPREARQAAEDATFAANRLRTLRPRLLARYHDISAAEMRQQYLARHDELKPEGEALAQELAELYPGLVGPLVDLFVRLRAFQQQCRALHLTDPGGLPHVLDPELKARGLHGFTRDTPSLLESVHLHDWQSGREIWPPRQPSFAAEFAASMTVPSAGPYWADEQVRARIASEQQQQRERMAAHYETQAAEQLERENRTLCENWEASQRRE